MGRYDEASKRAGAGKYVRFESGKKTRLRVLTDPVVSRQVFDNDPDRIVESFSWLVWNYDLERVQILQKGAGFFNRIASIVEDYNDEIPMGCDLNIEAKGSGIQTKYEINAVPTRGTMPVAVLKSLPDLTQEVRHSITIQDYAQGANPDIVRQDGTVIIEEGINPLRLEEPEAEPDLLPEGEEVPANGTINLDDIPF